MPNVAAGLFKIILGAILLLISALLIIRWWPQLLALIKGTIGVTVLVAGLLVVVLGFSDLRG